MPGFLVKSRAVPLDPPPPEAVDYSDSTAGDGDAELFAGDALAVGLVLLEVVLLAGRRSPGRGSPSWRSACRCSRRLLTGAVTRSGITLTRRIA